MENKNMNNLNDPNHNKKGRKTKTGIAIALLLTGFVIGGTVLVNNGKGQTMDIPQKEEVGEVVAEEFKYKGEVDGSTLYIEEELAKIDREETNKRQEEFKKQLAEQKQEEERLAEEARVKAEEEARVKAEEEARVKAEEEARIVAQQQAQKQAQKQAPKQKTKAPKQKTQAPKQNTPAPQPSTKPQEPNVDTQQPESDPVEGDGEKETHDPGLNFDRDELYYYGYTQNGVEGHQW